MSTTYLYICAGIGVVLVFMLLAQICTRNMNDLSITHYKLLLNTPKGLIKSDNKTAANTLVVLRKKLLNGKGVARDSCARLTPLISASIRNLERFIKENPKNAKALCTLELRSDIINQSMQDSMRPGSDWKDQYHTLLDWEENENRMVSNNNVRLEYLIRNLDIIIGMLRRDVCDYGRLNLNKLYDILTVLAEWGCAPNAIANVDDQSADVDDTGLPIFMESRVSIEPMDSRNSMHREAPSRESFASASDTSFGDINERSPVNSSIINGASYYAPVYRAADRSIHLQRKSNFDGQVTDFEIPENANDYSEMLGTTTVLNRASSYYYNKMGSTLLDGSFEGLVERDILGYRQPGHIIRQLYDPSDHFTVNINSCLGKTVSDDELWSQCTQYDMRPKLALDGQPQFMIDGLEHSLHA